MSQPFQFRVERGVDPDVLGLTGKDRKDPSGFERDGVTQRDFSVIRDNVQAGLEQTFRRAPEALLQFAPPTIHLYSNFSRRSHGARASTLSDKHGETSADYKMHHTPSGTRVEVTRYRLEPLLGISNSFLPEEVRANPAEVQQAFAHEGMHILTNAGTRFSRSVNEAIACRLEETMFGPNTSAENDQWSETQMSSTCGLRAPEDFAEFGLPNEARQILYIGGPLGLRFLTAEKIWQLCGKLVENAHAQKRLGMYRDFEHVTRSHLPDHAENILQAMPVKEVAYGPQQFVFPNKRPDRVVSYTFNIERNPNYGYLMPDGLENHIATWNTVPMQKMNMRPYVRGVKEPLVATFNLTPQVVLDFTEIARAVEQSTNGKVRSQDLTHITCDLGLRMLDLLPPEPTE